MSIFYIIIKDFDPDGTPVSSKTIELFKDENEMINWFAYGYENEYSRYQRMLSSQRCCKNDVFVSKYKNVPINDLFPGRDNIIRMLPCQYSFRNHMLYDADNCRILNVRNYESKIANASHNAIRDTEYTCRYREKQYALWRHTHGRRRGRSHQKSGHYKKITLGKDNIKKSDKRFGQFEQNDTYSNMTANMTCSFPVRVRGKTRMKKIGWWDDYYAPTENNWKEKKIRYQWQFHKKNCPIRNNELRNKYKRSEMFSDCEDIFADE